MALNLDIVGQKLETEPMVYTRDDVILYALGIGAGIDDLDFIYEKNLKVYPTFAVLPFVPAVMGIFLEKCGFNLQHVLHGEHKIIMKRPIPVKGELLSTLICDGIYDKGKTGALAAVTIETKDKDGNVLFENKATLLDRSAGNFDGDRGPETVKIKPPENTAPDFSVTYATTLNQAAIYRLSGDKNPLHVDPAFAKKAGFERPILHGLCSFGHAGRAVLACVCGNDPARLKSFSARFMNVVYPGESLTVNGWKRDDGAYIVQVENQDGKPVLGNGLAEIA